MSLFIANMKNQSLQDHILGVSRKSIELINAYKITDKKIYDDCIYLIFYSSILHDIGKVHSDFQKYIKKEKNCPIGDFSDSESGRNKKFEGPYHNEISFAFSASKLKFDKDSFHRIINYSIYWHHPANTFKNKFNFNEFKFNSFEKIIDASKETDPEIEFKLIEFWNVVLEEKSKYRFFEKYNSLIERNELSQRTDLPEFVDIKNSLEERSLKRLILNTLIEADRYISDLENNELIEYLNKEAESILETDNSDKYLIKDITESDIRSKEQFELSKKISEHKMSICSVDPGAGKTSIALYWHFLNYQKNPCKLFFALPKQVQVTGLFKTISNDLNRICSHNSNISIEGVFSGKRQYVSNVSDETNLLTSDINIMVFDRLLSPCYERKQFSEFISALKSNLVIDEFHEFCWLYSMIEPLKEIIKIRKWINNGAKTLFLSGTPDPSLIRILFGDDCSDNKVMTFSRDSLSPVNTNKSYLVFKDTFPENIPQDSLVSFNTVANSQEYMLDKDLNNILHVHSKFTDNDKKDKIDKILLEHSVNNSDKITITAKILQSSFNLNYKNGFLVSSHPNTDAQTWGRINRFDNKYNGYIIMIPESDFSIFEDNKLGHKNINKKWEEFLKGHISTEKNYSIREMLSNFYDKFWSIPENVTESQKYIEKKSKEEFKKLSEWFPTRDTMYPTLKESNGKSKSLKQRFRGTSYCMSAAIYDYQGNCIGQLQDENLLNVSTPWEIKLLHDATKNFSRNAVSDIKTFNLDFDYNKYKEKFGFHIKTPYLTSFIISEDNKSGNIEIKRVLEKEKLHRIYNSFFGLIRFDLFEKLKDKLSQKKI